MNRKQRDKNRQNAKMLSNNAVICPECGERGKHYLVPPFAGYAPFWVCAKFYGADGRRLPDTYNVKWTP